ncbi:DUF3793 family protein [Peptostreptococcus faecalis]|uniref:DUF3793 family protein n=1 Tax=Peptostreptococcus faecalis TaxID=2045015 RepID=UPI000C7D581F|nr:DUF3793 family protein [Peptostreptococcus faecalis]
MTSEKFESILAYFCSPALLNKKVSNLVSVSKKDIPEIEKNITHYNKLLEKYSITIESICECGERNLLLVYKQTLLQKHLKDENVLSVLERCGYKKSRSLDYYVNVLKMRMKNSKFPHEIGVFLGYPIQDVEEFINKKGQDYKYCGYWKVYSDIEEAKSLFDLYDKMRVFMMDKLNSGECLENILSQNQKEVIIA